MVLEPTTLLYLMSEYTLLKMMKLKEHLIQEHPKIFRKKQGWRV